MLSRLFGRKEKPLNAGTAVPAELVASIESAVVTFRDYGDDDGGARVLVKVSGVGAFYWTGLDDAAKRVGRAWPDLPETTARKAARLLASVMASRNRGEFKDKPQRMSWVNSWRF